jgi:hypothetical protein
MSELVLLVVIVSAIWVGLDAQRLGVKAGILGGGMVDIGPAGWFLVVLGLWIIGFPAYLATRPRYLALTQGETSSLTVSAAPLADAGWRADPSGRHELRYWDGASWTGNVSDNGERGVDPL